MPRMEESRRAHGDIVRALRIAQQRVQQEVADASGVPAPYVCLIEKGRRRPSPAYTEKLAHGLGVHADVLSGQVPVLATLRDIRGLTRAEFAEAVGITTARLQRLEHGLDSPDPALIIVMARRLGVDPNLLVHPREAPGRPAARAS